MTVFSPQTLSFGPQTVADYLTEQGGAPGAIVSVFDGARFASAASGVGALEGAATQVTQSFEIGSQSKMMTALIVLQLAEEGLLDLDARVADYLDPALVNGVANADTATVGQALAMTTGILNYTEVERPDGGSLVEFVSENPDEIFDAEEIVALLQGLPANAPVGTTYEYSNANYFYLSAVIEAVTGQPLGAVFNERIFDPLGMESTFLNDFRSDPTRVSSYLELDGELYDVTDVLVDANGEGGVISTVADMTTFLHALLVDQTLASDTVLAAMTDFDNASLDPRGFLFNAGLVALELEGIGSFVGFSGGTLGTDSASYLHLESGRILSVAVTQSNLDVSATTGVLYGAALAGEDAAWLPASFEDGLVVDGVSAADLTIAYEDGDTVFSDASASIALEGRLIGFESDAFDFTDGSQLHLGTDQDDVLSIIGGSTGARQHDNQLRGFDGDDQLLGALGDDKLRGGNGEDVLRGRAGDDRLFGGRGADDIYGGAGSDHLVGGTGADRLFGGRGDDWLVGGSGDDLIYGGEGVDVFVFQASARNEQTDFDIIADFQVGRDKLLLRNRDVVEASDSDEGLVLTLDGDGDAIVLLGVHALSETDFF